MKLPVAMCAPRPGRLGPIFAEPTIASPSSWSSTATTIRHGGGSIHSGRAAFDDSPSGYV